MKQTQEGAHQPVAPPEDSPGNSRNFRNAGNVASAYSQRKQRVSVKTSSCPLGVAIM